MAAVIVIADDVAVFTLIERTLCLLLDEIIGEAWAMDHFVGAKVLNDVIAGHVADDRQMIVIRWFWHIRGAAWQILLVVIAIHVQSEQKLTLAVFAVHAPGPFFGSHKRRQKQGREDRDDRNDNKQFDQSEGPPGNRLCKVEFAWLYGPCPDERKSACPWRSGGYAISRLFLHNGLHTVLIWFAHDEKSLGCHAAVKIGNAHGAVRQRQLIGQTIPESRCQRNICRRTNLHGGHSI